MLEEETRFIDFAAGRLSVPRMGHQQLFKQGEVVLTHFSMDFGRLYFAMEGEVNEGFKLASDNASSVEYEDKTLIKAGLSLHPNLVVVDVDTDKKIALQLLDGITALGQACSRTQISTLFVSLNFRTINSVFGKWGNGPPIRGGA